MVATVDGQVGSLVWVVSPFVLLTSIFIGILGAFMNCERPT